ncbi:MAG: hypothetical protein AMXMBFR64_58670 [Myxococcales bacterium]
MPELLSSGDDEEPDPGAKLPGVTSPEDQVLKAVAGLVPTTPVRIAVKLPEVQPKAGSLAALDDEARLLWVEARKEELKPSQQPVLEQLLALGATDVRSHWLVNTIMATLPAGAVPEVAKIPGVTLALDSAAGGSGVAYSGREGRGAMLTDELLNHGYDGGSGGRGGGRTRIGIIEYGENDFSGGGTNWVHWDHVGWLDTPGGASRLLQYDCRTGTCAISPFLPTVPTHGTAVTWAAAGSIEEGQDPAHPGAGTAAQIMRSGQAREASVNYYLIDDCSDVVAALERATLDGVDVANLSIWMGLHGSPDCDDNARTYDCGGINGAIAAARTNGMLVLACSGNEPEPGPGCNMWYPGWRTDTLAVSGLLTDPAAVDYNASSLSDDAPAGFVPVALWNTGAVHRFAGIDLCAPGHWSYNFMIGPSGYNTQGVINGCSFATPAVAGSAALLRDVYHDLGFAYTDAGRLFVSMVMLGDAWSGVGGTDLSTGLSYYSGFGRLHMHYPSDDNLVAPWEWFVGSAVINSGTTTVFQVGGTAAPEPVSLQQLKWAVVWFEPDMNAVAVIRTAVVDTCDPSGRDVVIASDSDINSLMRRRIRLEGHQIMGRCLELRIAGSSVPPAGRRVYTAWYTHSGNPAQH